MKREVSFLMPAGSEPVNVLDYLAHRFTYHNREAWAERLAQGRVRVNGKTACAMDRLASGDRLDYDVRDLPEPPVQTGLSVLFEDVDILAVDKPGNLPCHPGGAYFNNTLWAILKSSPYQVSKPSLVNRLDRETSGIVIVAKNAEAARGCRAEFAGRQVEKVYQVLVEGLFPETRISSGLMTADTAGPVRKRRLFVDGIPRHEAGSDWAETAFRRLSEGRGISFVEARPSTGRLHQIRATLHALGFPVAGDKLYGIDPGIFLRFFKGEMTEADRQGLRMERQALHAGRLRLRHPRTKQWLDLEAPLPADMAALVHNPGIPSDLLS